MKKSLEKITLLISSCDKFSDLWDTHIRLLNENWLDRPNAVLVTDKNTSKVYHDISIYSAGNSLEMPQRLKKALELIDSEYVFLTLDDYFLTQKINNGSIEELIEFADDNQIDYIRLFKVPNDKVKVDGQEGLFWINLDNNYALNLYPGIWRKSFLYKMLTDNSSAWSFEVSLTPKAKACNARCILSKRGEFPFLDIVRKGKVLHKANRYFRKHNIDIGARPLVSYKTEIRYFIVGTGSQILPKGIAKDVKKILNVFGMHFYSDGD